MRARLFKKAAISIFNVIISPCYPTSFSSRALAAPSPEAVTVNSISLLWTSARISGE